MSTMHNKRLKNEKIRDKWGRNVYYNKEENKIYAFYENYLHKQNYLLTLNISNRYPFKPPEIYVNNKNIIDFYADLFGGNSSTFIQKQLQDLFHGQCMCCSTILCKNNWGPQHTIKDILEEFTSYINLKQRVLERFWLRATMRKYNIPLHIRIWNYN